MKRDFRFLYDLRWKRFSVLTYLWGYARIFPLECKIRGERMKRLSQFGPSKGTRQLVFLIWLLYTVSYFGKLNFSANINQIISFYHISKAEAGLVPSFFFFSYAIGQIFNGLVCRKYNIKWSIFISLIVSSGINLIVAISTDFRIIKWLWLVNGFVLSILWPVLVRLISEVLPRKDLGKSSVIMGTTVPVGTLVIYCLSSVYVSIGLFKLAFYTAAVTDALVAVLWLIYYKRAVNKAREERSNEGEIESVPQETESGASAAASHKALTVTIVLICLFAIMNNLIKDGLTTWVPSILKEEFFLSDWLSILLTLVIPIIAVFGSIGALKLNRKFPDYVTNGFVVFAVMGVFVLAIIASISLKQVVLALVGLMVVNFFAASLNNLITSIFPIFMRGKVNSGLFAGVLNGFCYVGSAMSSYGLGYIADGFGWTVVFWILFGCCCFACLVWLFHICFRKFLLKKS